MEEKLSLVGVFDMPFISEEVVCEISVKNLPKRGKIELPTALIIDGDMELSFQDFKDHWAHKSFSPILIGEGITQEKLEDLDENFFLGLCIDLEDENLYIVDLPTRGHESFSRGMTELWRVEFQKHFRNWIDIADHTGSESFQGMEADDSWTFSELITESPVSVPFLILEVSWYESFASVRRKVKRWFRLGVLYAVVVKKFMRSNRTTVLLMQNGVTEPIQKENFKHGDHADFPIRLSKSFIFEHYPVQVYDLKPDTDKIELPVDFILRF